MLLQSLRALCKAPGGPGSIWKYLQALVKATGVSGRCVCGFRTNLRFADVPNETIPPYGHSVFIDNTIPTERRETVKLRLDGDMQCDAWYWHQARRHLPLRCL